MFERFTDRARRVLVLAQEEARLLNHDFIGTEHILLGLIAEGDGLAAKALGSLDISLEAVRDKVEEAIGPAGSAPTGSPPFTPRAKKVLELSLREALQLGHNYIGTEHMLLGLIREGEGVAAQVLVSLGADLARVREAVLNLLSEYERRSGRPAPRGLSITTREAAREGASDSAWESAWAAAGTASVGKELLIEVVREGRRPEDYTAAYRELAQLLQRHGWVLDDLDAAEITVTSVETSQGPGLRVRVRHRIEEPAAEPDEPDLRSG